jgi:citrate synthase
MGWPRGTPIALFALGRSIGWIAHVIEQYATDRLIRPRARYTGPAPSHPLSSSEERDA